LSLFGSLTTTIASTSGSRRYRKPISLPMLPPELNRGHAGVNFEGSRKMLNDAKATFYGNRLARQFGVAK
jgi:hypothetical protein